MIYFFFSLRRDEGLACVPDILKLVAKVSHLAAVVLVLVVVAGDIGVVVVDDVTQSHAVIVDVVVGSLVVVVVVSFVLGYHGPVSSVGEVLA